MRFVWHRLPGLAERFRADDEAASPQPGLGRTTRGFDDLKAVADREGFETLIVIFPFFRDFDRYPFVAQHAAIAAEARARGFDVLDLLPTYREASTTEDLCSPCCDLHPNEAGHAVTAVAIADHLSRRPL